MTSARLDQHLLAEQVGELAPDRGGRGHREQGGHDDPGVAGLAAVEVGDDPRERVGDDGAREHRDEHREQEAAERLEHLAVGHLARAAPDLLDGRAVGTATRRLDSRRVKVVRGNIFPDWLTVGNQRGDRHDTRGGVRPGNAATRRRGPSREARSGGRDDRSPAGRVTAVDSPAALGGNRLVLLAGSHLTRPRRIHSSDHLLSRVPTTVRSRLAARGPTGVIRPRSAQGPSATAVRPPRTATGRAAA